MALQKVSHIFTKIVFKPLRTNLFHIVLVAIFISLGTCKIYSQEIPKKNTPIPAKTNEAIKVIKVNEVVKSADSNKTNTPNPKKPLLESKVKYKALNYVKIDQKKKLITLQDKAELYYQDVELKSGIIVFDYQKNEVNAGRLKDSVGNYTQYPNFKQGSSVVEPDSIRFNFKTKKALVWNSRTEQGEMRIKAAVSKKENDSVYFMKKARFTTSKDIENPEYYFQTSRVKLVPGKKIVTGLTNLVIADVPTPLALPFAFFPMSEKSRSGIIMPTYGDNAQRGYSLQNGGYYFALSDYYDLAVLGDYYTNGGYATRFESSYGYKYHFRGSVNIRFENQINSERGFSDYSKTSIYNIQWSHSRDAKANPNSTFSASVNLGSSKFFQQSLNNLNNGSRLNNTLSSSISYSKRFNTIPQVNMSIAATHSQNTQSQQINMTLPSLQLSVDRVYPFAPKDGIKKGFIKNINLQYSLKAENRIVTTDSLFFKPQMFKDAKNGMQHSIPLSTNFKVFKYFSATTGINYNEVWYLKTINRKYDTNQNKLVDTEVSGFDAFRTYSFSSSLGTTVYGTFNISETKKIQAIRHVVRPSISYSYTPSFKKYYDTYASDASGTIRKDYTRFEAGIFGGPSKNYSNNVGFSINNTFEAKVRDKDSTKTVPKKIMLLNNLNISTSYDISADSLKWAPVRISAGTLLFNDKMNINLATTLNPYALNNKGQLINTYNINNGGSLFRMTSANATLNYSLSNKNKDDKKKKNEQGAKDGGRGDDLFGSNADISNHKETLFKEDEEKNAASDFFKAKIPWDLTLAYSVTYTNINRENKFSGNTLMMSANVDLTPKWRMGASSGYDLVQRGVTYTNLRMERDLLSWRMSFNWIPFGTYTSWGFFIGIKSGVLSDVKWEKRKSPDKQLR